MLPETDLSKIHIPAPMMQGGFVTLADAVLNLYYPDSYLEQIVRQNICYREYERAHGARAVIDRIIDEAPVLGQSPARVGRAVEYLTSHPIGDIDIQCYPINKPLTLCGHTFADFADLRKAVELTGHASHSHGEPYRTYAIKEHTTIDGVHVASMNEDYPRFDSYDACDNRMYQNYVVGNRPFTSAILNAYARLPHGFNYCKVLETLPAEMLPLVYYSGDGNYLMVATGRRREAQS